MTQNLATPLIYDIDDRTRFYHSIELQNILIGMSNAAVADVFTDLARCIGSVKGDFKFVEVDLGDAKRVFLGFAVRLDRLLFRVDALGRHPLWIKSL